MFYSEEKAWSFPLVTDEKVVDDFQFYISQNNISEHWNEQCQWLPNAVFPIPTVVFQSKIVREFCKIMYWKTWKSQGNPFSWSAENHEQVDDILWDYSRRQNDWDTLQESSYFCEFYLNFWFLFWNRLWALKTKFSSKKDWIMNNVWGRKWRRKF